MKTRYCGKLRTLLCLLASALIACCGFAFAGCSEPDVDFKIGILQQLPHQSLDQANKGFRDKLTALMTDADKTVWFQKKNANNEQATANTIANTFVSKQRDLILAIGTNATQAAATATAQHQEIPVLFTAVTDPVEVRLVESNQTPGKNITGTSDLNPVAEQIRLAGMLAKGSTGRDANKIGFLYTTSETNSIVQLELARTAAADLGLTLEEQGISDANDLQASFNLLVSKNVGAIYVPTDNTLANATSQLKNLNSATTARLPMVLGAESMTEECGIATYGIDYYQLGVETAEMAFDILVNHAQPSTMSVKYVTEDVPFKIYKDNAAEINYTIPADVLALENND